MTSTSNADFKAKLESEFSRHLRVEDRYVTGGVAVQANSIKRLGFVHRGATDVDIISMNLRTSVEVYPVEHFEGSKQFKFNIVIADPKEVKTPFVPIILESKNQDIFVQLGNRENMSITYDGNLRYEAIESHMPSKAFIVSKRLHVRLGEIGKDIFDMGITSSSIDSNLIDKKANSDHYINEMFFISSSLVNFYPKPMTRRVDSSADTAKLVKLAESGRERFFTNTERLGTFFSENPAVLPSMLLAANDISNLKAKIPRILESSSSSDERITEINGYGLMGLLKDQYENVRSALKKTIKAFS